MGYNHDHAKGGRRVRALTGCSDKNVYLGIGKYIKEKIKILKELHIFLTEEEEAHLRSLDNEVAIDDYARSLILNRE